MLRGVAKLFVYLIVLGVVWFGVLIMIKLDADRVNGLLFAAEQRLAVPEPVTHDLITYQSATGLIDESRPWGLLIVLVVAAFIIIGGLVSYLLIGPGGLNKLVRRPRRTRQTVTAPKLTISPPLVQDPPQLAPPAETAAAMRGNPWLLPPGD